MLGKIDDAMSSLKIKPNPAPSKKRVRTSWIISAPVYTKMTRMGWGRGYHIPGMGVLYVTVHDSYQLLSKTVGANWLNNSSSYVQQEMD